MSIESGGYFGSNSAEEQPMLIRRYHLDRCEQRERDNRTPIAESAPIGGLWIGRAIEI